MDEETVLQKDARYIVSDMRKARAGLGVLVEDHWQEMLTADWNAARAAMDAMDAAITVLKEYRKPRSRPATEEES
jgi:hypothetical protein